MILDTNAISSLLRGDTDLVRLLGTENHQLPAIALGEYRYGLRRSRLANELEQRLSRFESIWNVLAVDRQTTHHYARIRDQLRNQGTPIPENDVWIAALAAQHQLPVATRDEHFDHVHEIVRVSWTESA